MRALLIASLEPHAGKTGLAAALARRFAFEGRRVLALRLGAGGDQRAGDDAAYFATLPGARGRGGSPIAPSVAATSIATLAGDATPIVEAQDGADVPALARELDAGTVLIHHGLPDEDAVLALQNLALALAERFVGVVLTALPERSLAAAESLMADAALPMLAALPEDRLLYSPTIAEIAAALDAELLLGEESEDQVIEQLLISPITTDPGQPYFSRRGDKAVIVRSDKTDQQLAAMQSNTDCLILTGGLQPSPYTLDRAANEEIALLLTRGDTRATIGRLESIYASSRFSSERKLERMAELLQDRLDAAPIAAALA
ncbi:MAG: DRTGG domain-containing protein [Dehalococcoidia bacterium]